LVGWEKSCFGRRPAGMPDFLQNETGGLTAPVFFVPLSEQNQRLPAQCTPLPHKLLCSLVLQ